MKTIARVVLDGTQERPTASSPRTDPWREIAARAADWARVEGIAWRDAIVLVPFLEMLAPARRAFAKLGVWMPRIETTRTLAASLGPPVGEGAERGFDAALDTLVAMQLLAREPWGADWARRDPRGFEHGAKRIVATAHELGRAAAAVTPGNRPAWWDSARSALRSHGGAGARERLLAQVAVEWAAAAPAAATDRLFALRPSAWICVEAGGPEPLFASVSAASELPALVIATDVPLVDPFAAIAATIGEAPAFALCDGFEDEASAAAAQVLAHLDRDERPIALIAEDRVLVRRIRALLEREGVRLNDETGWKLSTTRAGATLMAWLMAARHTASTDAYLDWLKASPFAATAHSSALASLESQCRRFGATRRDAIAALSLAADARRLHDRALATLHDIETPARRSLPDWLDAFRAALDRSGALASLRDDAAGRQALAALAIEPPLDLERRGTLAGEVDAITLAELTRWVDDIFESVAYRPESGGDVSDAHAESGVDVVVTPLARAMLRPFSAVVFPGADDQTLGRADRDDSLLPRAVAEALALPDAGTRRDAELFAFAQALRLPHVTLLRRRGDASEPVAESALVERLRLALAEHRRVLRPWFDPRVERRIAAEPVRPSAPSVPGAALPQRLSASAFEALRACPYQFFARHVLRLGEADELDDEVEKRDYGSWLHAVLHAFHLEREGRLATIDVDPAAETARLREIGVAALADAGLDAASFLPFDASFAAFAPRYVAWLHERERQGWRWLDGEVELAFAPAELEGVELFGRIDRIDRRGSAGEAMLELIDYKTGSASRLKEALREPLEDSQLAFYAVLVGAQTDGPVQASYLALDGTRGLERIEHPDVAASARALVAGAAVEWRRLRKGAGLAPLGAGSACEYCQARGLCRRDHWSVVMTPSGDERVPAAADDERIG
jgi:ATP-dependent helicase/nuclease subunit B